MNNHLNLESGYLGGDHHINTLFKAVCSIKNNGLFYTLYRSKDIIVQQGNVYIGTGRKDNRSIIIIPVISPSPDTPNIIEYLLLLNISFRENVILKDKIKALGGKYERIKNIVQENSFTWNDKDLELIEMEFLFGRSAEKIGEHIVSRLK